MSDDFLTWTVKQLRQKRQEIQQEQQRTQEEIDFWKDANEWLERRSKRERD